VLLTQQTSGVKDTRVAHPRSSGRGIARHPRRSHALDALLRSKLVLGRKQRRLSAYEDTRHPQPQGRVMALRTLRAIGQVDHDVLDAVA
jgi:hypothetical protein